MSCRQSVLVLCLAALVCAASFVAPEASAGSPPECDGISGVFPTNPDLIGDLTTFRVASGLLSPVHVAQPPGDNTRLFVVEQQGIIRIVINGVTQAPAFLDIDNGPVIVSPGNEEGLLSMAFDPDYQTNGHFFVYYTATGGGSNVVARYTVLGDPATSGVANEATAQIVLSITHNVASNHNGGQIMFGADDHLYIATGDGGSACDPGPGTGNAQNTSSLLGKMLRLDVHPLPYTTAGNPFVGIGASEVWSYGLRNPYRFSVDKATGNLLIGDVGQNAREELDCGNSSLAGGGGENYGWATHEGTLCGTCTGSGLCNPPAYRPPIQEYAWSGGFAAIGGYVYRGCRMAGLNGHYFYSDHAAGFIRTLELPNQQNCPASVGSFVDRTSDLAPGGGLSISQITSYGQDNRGEVYIVDRGGEVFKIIPNLSIMEISGPNAAPLTMASESSWSWESLAATYEGALTQYKIYRSIGDAEGPYTCIGRIQANTCSGSCNWTGDPTLPIANEVFYYLITATGTGGETTAGAASDGTLRVVNTASACQL